MVVRNPIEWSVEQARLMGSAVGSATRAGRHSEASRDAPRPAVRRIALSDLRAALAKGLEDFGAQRTDVLFLCIIYPVAGIALTWLASGAAVLPLLFPLASGFALIGPMAAVGLYEMSRRREQGMSSSWADGVRAINAPAFGAIAVLGLLLLAVFLLWLVAAHEIYQGTLGPQPPASIASFASEVLTTKAGWEMVGLGFAVGFLFAVVVLAISVVSFPLLLDRDVGLVTAVSTSIRSVAANPGTMALWGLIVAASLVIGSVPLFLGLIVVMPVLGHATWHLYRRLVRPPL